MNAPIHPLAWRSWAKTAGSDASAPVHLDGAIIQCWRQSSSQMDQPPLDHHYIAFHLGGPKRVIRSGAGRNIARDIAPHSCTTVEAGSTYAWSTIGPVEFAHLYIDPGHFARTVAENGGGEPARISFAERIGAFDPLLSRLLTAIVGNRASDDIAQAAQEACLDAALMRLYEQASVTGEDERRMRMTPRTLARVRDYIEAHLQDPIRLQDLAELAGYSRFHFARAFRATTGLPPYSFILRERAALACRLLEQTDMPVKAVAKASGFTTHALFASRFRQLTGVAPSMYRGLRR